MSGNGCSIKVDTKEIEEMIGMLNKLGKSPQKAVTRAAGKAGMLLKRRVKQEAPKKSGTLRKALIRVGESNHGKRGKKAYQVTFDRKYNEMLQKPIKTPGLLGGKNKKAYYPFSVNFGFLARAGGSSPGLVYHPPESDRFWMTEKGKTQGTTTQRVEGQHFMEEGTEKAEPEVMSVLEEKTMEELEKIWQSAK